MGVSCPYIVIPYQQLIHTLLYLLYKIIHGIVQLHRKSVYPSVKKAKNRLKKTSQCSSRISKQYIKIQWGYFWQNLRCLGSWRVFDMFSQLNRDYSFQFSMLQSLHYDCFCINLLNYQNTFEEQCWKVVRMNKKTSAHIYNTVKSTCFNYYISFHFKPLQVYPK